MKITDDMIHPNLRKRGVLIRKAFHFKTPKTFQRMQGFINVSSMLMRPKGMAVKTEMIKSSADLELPLYIAHAPEKKADAVGILWIHGGGYANGTPRQDYGFMRNFIGAANSVIVSPDYRLSLDAPYPAAINDCYDALIWMKEHAHELGIRSDQLFVGGDSAGGGLAAALAIMARDKGEVAVAFQMPFYPMLDDRMITPSSQNNDAPLWDSHANELAWKMYLGDLYGTYDVPAYAAPARETDFRNLPPTYTFVGSIEPFHDETVSYVHKLQEAGVSAKVDVYEGAFHAFDLVGGNTEIAVKARNKYLSEFQYAVKHYFAPQK